MRPSTLPRVRIAATLLGLLGLLGLFPACRGCGAGEGAGDAAVTVAAPVPAPEGLLAEATLADPNLFWTGLQKGVGGVIALLPRTLGGLVTSLGGIDPGLATEIEGGQRAYAVAAATPAGFGYAAAVKLGDERRARARLFEGNESRYVGKDVAGMTLLVPKGGGTLPVVAAVAPGGFLVLARSEADLAGLGPYVHRTLPTRPEPASALAVDVPRAALAGPLRERLTASWAAFRDEKAAQAERAREAHGRAADFADPGAILASVDAFARDTIALVGGFERARIAVDPAEGGLRAVTLLDAAEGGAAAAIRSMAVGDVAGLLDAPAASVAVFAKRSSRDERLAASGAVTEALAGAFGERLPPEDRVRLDEAAGEWTKARGDTLSAAWLRGESGVGRGALVRVAAEDPAAAARGVRGLTELLNRPVFRRPLEAAMRVQKIVPSTVDVPDRGKADVVWLRRGGAPTTATSRARDAGAAPSGDASSLAVGWLTGERRLDLAFAEDPATVLRAAAPGSATLAGEPALVAAAGRWGAEVHAVVFVRRAAFESRPPPNAPGGGVALLAGWGRQGTQGRLDVEASHALLREIVRQAGGF